MCYTCNGQNAPIAKTHKGGQMKDDPILWYILGVGTGYLCFQAVAWLTQAGVI